jgi:hypothetical protein
VGLDIKIRVLRDVTSCIVSCGLFNDAFNIETI